jgi:hypothetical protein
MNLKLNLVKRDNAIIAKEISINKVLSRRKNPRGIGQVMSSSRLLKETNTAAANRIVPPFQLNFVKIKENIEKKG